MIKCKNYCIIVSTKNLRQLVKNKEGNAKLLFKNFQAKDKSKIYKNWFRNINIYNLKLI